MSSSELISNANAHKLVTEDRIKSVLAKDQGPYAKYKCHEIANFCAKGDNYGCFVTSIQVTYSINEREESVSYIAKLNPCVAAQSRNKIFLTTFTKEGKFYEDLLPKLNSTLSSLNLRPLRIPLSYFTSLEEDKQAIFLRDMRKDSYKLADHKLGLDDEHVKLVMEELGRLHAASVLLERAVGTDRFLEDYPFFDDLFASPGAEISTPQFKTLFNGYLKYGADVARRFDGYEKVAEALDEKTPHGYDLMKQAVNVCDPKFLAFTHGDCWSNNLLFK